MSLNVDLHTHSFFSGDGVSSPEDLIAAARAKGLSGIAITDHNTCDAVNYLLEKGLMRLDGLPVDNFLILSGVEVTTADGHLLCIGATLPYLKGKPAREVCEMIHERGGRCTSCRRGRDRLHDCEHRRFFRESNSRADSKEQRAQPRISNTTR